MENLERPRKDKSQREEHPAVGHRASRKPQVSAVTIGSEEMEILEQLGQHEGQHKDQRKNQHRAQNLAKVKHKISNATNASTESKELEILEEDLSLVGSTFVTCRGSLEGVTMMRDMDWR